MKGLICKYCEYYNAAKKRKYDSESIVKYRKCEVKNDYIRDVDKVCSQFVLTNYIYCNTFGYWITPAVCIARVKNKSCSKKCRIYLIVKEYYAKP